MEKRSSFRITAVPPCGETCSERSHLGQAADSDRGGVVCLAAPVLVVQVGARLGHPIRLLDQTVQGVVDDDGRHLAGVLLPVEPGEAVVGGDLHHLAVETLGHAVGVQGQSLTVHVGAARQLVVGAANHRCLQGVVGLRIDGVNRLTVRHLAGRGCRRGRCGGALARVACRQHDDGCGGTGGEGDDARAHGFSFFQATNVACLN